jgi:hypothetical protein
MLKILTVLSLVTFTLGANANNYGADTTGPLFEMRKLHSVFANDRTLAFDCTYYMEDVDTVTTRDTLAGFFKFFNEQYWFKMDSVEQLQDQHYCVTVYHEQETILFRDRTPVAQSVFQANVLDSAFLDVYVDSLTVTDTATYRKLKMHFKPGMPYTRYEILYDTANYYVHTIHSTIRKNMMGDPDIFDNHAIHLKVVFSNYTTNGADPSVYSTMKFVIRRNGEHVLKAPYTHYQLVNSINQ